MHITHLSLVNFRNYGRLELDLPKGPALLHGPNAQGKTNLLEAIYYLATARSSHADQDQQLMNWESVRREEPVVVGRLVAQLVTKSGPRQIEMRLIKEQQRGQASFRREALVDRRKVRLMDLLGKLRVVVFLPQDVQIVTGSPSKRRRYLDITLCQTDPIYCRNLSSYNRVLEQRNALLRRIAEQGNGIDMLPVFDEKLVSLGSQIFARRAHFVYALAREAQRIHYEELTDGTEVIRLRYLPRLVDANSNRGNTGAADEAAELGEWLTEQSSHEPIAERYYRLLAEVQDSEIATGNTRIGPHRDDWRIWISGHELSSYGSRGQQRSALLAIKLAEISWMAGETGETPVLLLDEVLAELDEQRRALLLRAVRSVAQAILTATDPRMFSDEFLQQATMMTVSQGQVTVDAAASVAALG